MKFEKIEKKNEYGEQMYVYSYLVDNNRYYEDVTERTMQHISRAHERGYEKAKAELQRWLAVPCVRIE